MTTPPYTFAITGHHASEKNLVFNAGSAYFPTQVGKLEPPTKNVSNENPGIQPDPTRPISLTQTPYPADRVRGPSS